MHVASCMNALPIVAGGDCDAVIFAAGEVRAAAAGSFAAAGYAASSSHHLPPGALRAMPLAAAADAGGLKPPSTDIRGLTHCQ